MNTTDMKIKTAYSGNLFTIKEVPQPDGRIFEECHRPSSVEVIPITNAKKIVLIKEIRKLHPGGIYAFPSGRVEKDDSLEEAANRELQEEAGYKAGTLEFFMKNKPSNTFKYAIHVFVGRDLVKSELPKDSDEAMTAEIVTIDTLAELAFSGNFRPDIGALAALRFYDGVKKGKILL